MGSTTEELKLAETLINQDQYPPFYYRAMSVLATRNVQSSVVLMRLLNSAIVVALLGLALWATSKRLRIAILKSWFVLLFPLTAFIIASVNPSSWAVAGVGTFWVFLAELLSNAAKRPKWPSIVGLSLSALMGLGSRTDSVFYLLISVVAVGIWCLSPRRIMKHAIKNRKWRVLVPSAVVLVAIYVANQLVYMFNRFDSSQNQQVLTLSLFVKNMIDLPMYAFGTLGSWGRPDWPFGLGWFDISVPQVVPIIGLLLFGHFMFFNRTALSTRTRIAATFLAAGSAIIVLLPLQLIGSQTDFFLQPRYLLPILFPIIGMTFSVDIGRHIHLYQKSPLVIAMSISGFLSLYSIVARYSFNVDVSKNAIVDLSSIQIEWWWGNIANPAALLVAGLLLSIIHSITASSLIQSTSLSLKELSVNYDPTTPSMKKLLG